MEALPGAYASAVQNNHTFVFYFSFHFLSFNFFRNADRYKACLLRIQISWANQHPTCCPTPADAVTNDELTKPMGPPFSGYYSWVPPPLLHHYHLPMTLVCWQLSTESTFLVWFRDGSSSTEDAGTGHWPLFMALFPASLSSWVLISHHFLCPAKKDLTIKDHQDNRGIQIN